jgi:transcriptional/translational regulatory protein YebC/TACO1
MEIIVEAGADDIQFSGDISKEANVEVQVLCERSNLMSMKKELESRGFSCSTVQFIYNPTSSVSELDEEGRQQFTKMLNELEDNDDVQEVFHNYSGPLAE